MAYGRLSEILGPETIPLDKYFRKLGMTHRVKHYMSLAESVEIDGLKAYAAGVNQAHRETTFLSPEFWVTMSNFEPWTPEDSVAFSHLFIEMLSRDWEMEMLRERLTEIYDRTFVDKLLPFNPKEHFSFGDGFPGVISDEDLEKIGMYNPGGAGNLYDLTDAESEELLSIRKKAEKISMEDPNEKNNSYKSYALPSAASNCWAVHGNHTRSGKPILACDPHLRKSVQSTWYAMRMSWYDSNGEKSYIAGGSLVGTPSVSYGRTKFLAFGLTALNPDVIDLYQETIKDG